MEAQNNTLKIAVVDDHGLYRQGLINLIHALSQDFNVTMQASNGREFLDSLASGQHPDIALVDIDMPIMNGFETAERLKKHYPQIHILIITMSDDEQSLVKMLKLGVKGFLSKDVDPDELKKAIITVSRGELHDDTRLSERMIHALQNEPITPLPTVHFPEKELEFVKLCCTEMTYKEIASTLNVSPKTVDGYRASAFDRIGTKSRVGVVMYALKHRIVQI